MLECSLSPFTSLMTRTGLTGAANNQVLRITLYTLSDREVGAMRATVTSFLGPE